jgi:DNA anti-recombination protein RmuC
MGLMDGRQQKIILKQITPLINQIADERVQTVMNSIQKQQIKSYEEFFDGQQERFDKAVNEHIEKSLKELIPEITEKVIEEMKRSV